MELKDILNKYGASKEPFFFIISYDLNNFLVKSLKELEDTIKFEINNKNFTQDSKSIKLKKNPISFKEYSAKFNILQNNIKDGNSYLLNLTIPTKIDIPLSLNDIYKKAKARFKLKFRDDFVCFSPERFIEIRENKIYTYPITCN